VQLELEQLLVLQDRDQKIRQIQTETKSLPLQRKNLEAQLATSVANLEALKQRARQLEVDRKRLELDVGVRADSVAKLRTQQYETRKNDEFAAMAHEIERYQKEISDIEDRELELMEQQDKLKAEVAAEEKKAAGTKDSIARQMTDLEGKDKALGVQLQELMKDRAELASKI
jgi:predicted  nucleic acid-binding Zn-ribbon protein